MRLRLNAGYGGIHATYWMVYAVISSFGAAFLLDKGYTNARIGIILAAANVVSVALQPFLADFADRSKRITLIEVTEFANILIGILLFFCLIMKRASFLLSVIYVVMMAWHLALQPLFNSMAFKLEESGHKINFGVTRAMGSLFYAVLCALLGVFAERFGTQSLPVIGEITLVLLIADLFITGRIFKKACAENRALADRRKTECSAAAHRGMEKAETEAVPPQEQEITLYDFVKRNKLFLIVSLGIAGIYFTNSITNNFMLQIVENVGGTSEDMGNIFSVMAFLEIPALFLFEKIHSRFSNKILLQFAAVCFVFKILMIFLARDVSLVYAAQLLQTTSFGLFLPAIVSFINEIMDKGEAVKGQALYTVVITATSVFASLLGGFILDYKGASAMLFVSAVITGLGTLLFLVSIEKLVRSKRKG